MWFLEGLSAKASKEFSLIQYDSVAYLQNYFSILKVVVG